MIDDEIAKGKDGYIFMKLNSLSDSEIIEKFVEASKAGVKIDLVIRGICCLVAGIKGKTENITVHSILGRFLEHSRIYVFGKKGQDKMYISSADMMRRNTENRVEVAAPILDADIKRKIYTIIEYNLRDNVGASELTGDGEYHHIIADVASRFSAQDAFMDLAIANAPKDRPKAKNIWDSLKSIFAK